MKNIDILNNYYKLEGVLLQMKPLPAKISFALVRNTNALRIIVQDIEQVKYKIVSMYGVQDENNPEVFRIKPKYIEIAEKELNELYETDTNVDLMQINLSDINGVQFTPAEMDALMFMIMES